MFTSDRIQEYHNAGGTIFSFPTPRGVKTCRGCECEVPWNQEYCRSCWQELDESEE